MKRVNSHTLGLAVGGFLAVYHLIWAGLVYFGADNKFWIMSLLCI